MIQEDKLINLLKEGLSKEFIGDDATILPNLSSNYRYVITKDMLIEDVHFRTSYFSPQDLAHKALHVNLSDVAAMGAEPLYILCGISIPKNLEGYALQFLSSLSAICQNLGVILIGGDTTASCTDFIISITAIGKVDQENIKLRNTSKIDNLICVVGNIGFAHLGFLGLEKSVLCETKFLKSFLRPEAKIKEGIWLGKQLAVTSMMDVSDGLFIDLNRLASSSKKHAVINLDLLASYLAPEISLQIALEGGEDYSLIVTISRELFEELSRSFMHKFGYDLKVIGHMAKGDGISFTQKGKPIELTINHFAHFGEKL